MQGPSKQELQTKTIGELRKQYPQFRQVYFELRDEDDHKVGMKYLSEFGTRGDEFVIESSLFGLSKQKVKGSNKKLETQECKVTSHETDFRCCPDCKGTNRSGAEFYKRGRSGIVYCKPCWRTRCKEYGKKWRAKNKALKREVEKMGSDLQKLALNS